MSNNSEELHFYYNRERRLENAPESVKDLYKEQEPKKNKLGLLGPLVADKPRRILFFVILILCLLIFALSRMGFLDDFHSLDGNRFEISGLIVGENTIVVIKKIITSADTYTGALDIAVTSPAYNKETEQPEESAVDAQVYYHRVFLTLEKEEEFRFAVPFDVSELLMVLQSEKSTMQLSFKPK